MSTMSSNPNKSSLPTLQVKKLRPEAVLPTRGSEWSAGYDLSSAEAKTIAPGARAVVKTALSIACPAGTYGRIAPRSGLAVKKGIDVGAGVVDADYRGEVGVVLFNLGQEDFEIQPGDRIAQLVLEQILMVPVEEVDELDETVRGAGGFGSTGIDSKRARIEEEANTISPNTSNDKMSN
jgi:deoxyuridine 5'-triphosphate nucleotidohydrolase